MSNDTKYIDWKVGVEHLGDEPMLRNFLYRFQQETLYTSISTIVKNAKAQNWEDVRREAHSLKGSSGYIGALTCQQYASDLQFATQETPLDRFKVAQALNNLVDHAQGLQEYLSNTFSKPFLDPEKIFTFRLSYGISPKLAQEILRKTPPNQKITSKSPEKDHTENERVVFPSEIMPNTSSFGVGSESSITIRKIMPPAFSRHIVNEEDLMENIDETELDAYDELNKQWRCMLI